MGQGFWTALLTLKQCRGRAREGQNIDRKTGKPLYLVHAPRDICPILRKKYLVVQFVLQGSVAADVRPHLAGRIRAA